MPSPAPFKLPRHIKAAPGLRRGDEYIENYTIYVNEADVYEWIFKTKGVNDKSIKCAVDHAIQKIHKFIDNL